jgi:hypothetical protein
MTYVIGILAAIGTVTLAAGVGGVVFLEGRAVLRNRRARIARKKVLHHGRGL